MSHTPQTPEEIKAAALSSHRAMYHKPEAKKRTGKTPEAKVSAAIDKYLKKIGLLSLRTHAGQLRDEQGHIIYLGKRGQSDRTCCAPGGVFIAIELKATTGLTEAQSKYLDRVRQLGGLAIVAYSVADLRTALVERFGPATVEQWENSGKARRR